VSKNQSDELDYSELGVEAPSHDEHEEKIPINVGFEWKQKGNYIYREGAEMRASSKIPTNYILKGTDEAGMPILEKLTV